MPRAESGGVNERSQMSFGDHEGGDAAVSLCDGFAAHSISDAFEESNGIFVALGGGEAEPFIGFDSRLDGFRFGAAHAGPLAPVSQIELCSRIPAFRRPP